MPGSIRMLPLTMGGMVVLAVVKLGGLAAMVIVPPAASPGRGSGLMTPAFASEPSPPKPPAAPAPSKPPPLPAPGPELPDAERSLLQDLRARREALDVRNAALDRREMVVKAAERGLQDRLDQLSAIQSRLEAMEKARSEREEGNWRGLVKTYEAMRPRDAALIFNELDPAVLVEVLDRMKEAKVAPILAAMQPDRARAATSQLAQWRQRASGGANG